MAISGINLHDLRPHLERNVSQRSLETSTLGFDAHSTADIENRPNQQHRSQIPLKPDLQQATQPSPQPLPTDKSALLANIEDDGLEPTKGKVAKCVAVCVWWIPELFASLVSIIMLGCIVALLVVYDHQLLTELRLPKYLTINGIIAALATINRACLNTPVCSALLQQMWLSLAQEGKANKSSRSRLRDLELYTDASSGAWGSLVFLFKARSARIAAWSGCMITILSLVFSTFTQQLISIELVPMSNDTSPGNIPRSETYTGGLPEYLYNPEYPQLEMISSIHSGMLSSNVRPIQASCPTANCTWPVTSTVAVCGACSESTYVSSGCNASCTGDAFTCNYTKNDYCNYSLPSGNSVQLWDFVDRDVKTEVGLEASVAFQVLPSAKGSIYSPEQYQRAYLATFDLFGLPYGYSLPQPDYSQETIENPRPESLDLQATECALWMCVQAYNTSIIGNVQHDELVGVYDDIEHAINGFDWHYYADVQLPAIPAELDRDRLTNFTVVGQAGSMLQGFLDNILRGNVSIFPIGHQASSDLVYGAWNGSSTNASAWIENVALSMTNTIRAANHMSRRQYNGTRYELAVVVHWYWLVLPAALVVASLVYLLVVMFQTAGSSVHSWKGSPLTLLLFELDPRIAEVAHGHVERRGGLVEAIGDANVRIERSNGGVRKLHAC